MEKNNPFLIFPEQLWLVILDKLETSTEIKMVVDAIPQLKLLTAGKQFSWLISNILPLLFPKYVDFSDMKVFRQVSRRWKHGVDKCLETHPDLSPYKTPVPGEMSETHLNYECFNPIGTRIYPVMWYEPDDSKNDWAVDTAQDTLTTTTTESPFPVRSLWINLEPLYKKMLEKNHQSQTFSDKCQCIPFRRTVDEQSNNPKIFSTLKNIGHHIWFVHIELPNIGVVKNDSPVLELIWSFVLCLSHLPNLKSVSLEGLDLHTDKSSGRNTVSNIIKALHKSSIPARVETLDLEELAVDGPFIAIYSSFVNLFANHSQIKKLAIHGWKWKKYLPSMLPNLVELRLDFDRRKNKRLQSRILKEVKGFPSLRKLCWFDNNNVGVNVYDLSQLQFIESLELGLIPTNSFLPESPTKRFENLKVADSVETCVSSVRFLKLFLHPTTDLTFLKMFSPSLEFLFVDTIFNEFNVAYEAFKSAGDRAFLCFYEIYENKRNSMSNIKHMWEEYPRLKMITVNADNGYIYQCVREDPKKIYETRKNGFKECNWNSFEFDDSE